MLFRSARKWVAAVALTLGGLVAGQAEHAFAQPVPERNAAIYLYQGADRDQRIQTGFDQPPVVRPHRPDLRFGPPLVAIYILADVGAIAGGWYSSALLRRGMATGRARIVIETSGPALIDRSYVLPPADGQPARLVVDLVPASADEFDAALVASESANREAIRLAAEAAATESPTVEENVATAPESESPETVAPTAEKPRRHDGRRLIVIDPGHGGIDPGAIGVKRTREKDVVLAFGLALRDVLMKTGQYEVVMTRDSDEIGRAHV